MSKLNLTVVAAALMGAMAVPAAAEAPDTLESSVTVPYGDLDLTSPSDAKVLETRVENAAEKVCARPDVRNLKANQAFEVCKTDARDRAMEQLSLTNPFENLALASLF
jgi:UrcA family protein